MPYRRIKSAMQLPAPAQAVGFRETISTLLEYGIGTDTLSPDKLEFPVSRRTKVEVRFHGPAGADEWDALLAHIAFYKTWFKDDAGVPAPLRRDELIDAIVEAVERANLKPDVQE